MTKREAKEIYLNSDCSYFLMCTNDYSGYIEYRQLGLQQTQEEVWKNEKIQMLSMEMKRTGDYRLFSRLYNIAEEFRDFEKLEIMLDALSRIKSPMTPEQRVDVAETILGRRFMRVRSGLIYWAYDLKQKGTAILLADEVIRYLTISNVTSIELDKRIQKGKRLCQKIAAELKLNFADQDFADGVDYYRKSYATESPKPTDIWRKG